jgi:AraC-like DNA-binding protein
MLHTELKNMDIQFKELGVGLIEIIEDENNNSVRSQKLSNTLKEYGLKLMPDNKSVIVNKIKTLINEWINSPAVNSKYVLSAYISDKLNYDYTYLYNLFSASTGMSIKWYEMVQKIEKVKYLLEFEQLPITEITYLLNYSSVAHLSSQFKKITGLTPSEFKNRKNKRFFTTERKELTTTMEFAK